MFEVWSLETKNGGKGGGEHRLLGLMRLMLQLIGSPIKGRHCDSSTPTPTRRLPGGGQEEDRAGRKKDWREKRRLLI